MRLVFANVDYRTHSTDEGEQLQAGLASEGWMLVGHGYRDSCCDVPTLIERYKPKTIFVQDCRDWRRDSTGCYNPNVEFKNWQALKKYPEIFKIMPVKDAGTMVGFQREFAEAIGLNAAVTYYHDRSVLAPKCSPWLTKYPRVRTYHSVDATACQSIDLHQPRKRCLVSGAVSAVYPMRVMAFCEAEELGASIMPHPGYGNRECYTQIYLRTLARYRVHIACSSQYGFSLRKIIESVAMGCTPVTDLPAYDVLPEIDEAIVRVPQGCDLAELKAAVEMADSCWDSDCAIHFARIAQKHYDYRRIGRAMSNNLAALKRPALV